MHRRYILLILALFFIRNNVNSQSSNFRAQGFYYKAKENYVSQSYENALIYVAKSKEALGGTNIKLQYLHIMILVKLEDWMNAYKEMSTFYDMEEGNIKAILFSDEVDELTKDETYELTKIMIDIEEKCLQSPENKKSIKYSLLSKNIRDSCIPPKCMYAQGTGEDKKDYSITYSYKCDKNTAGKIKFYTKCVYRSYGDHFKSSSDQEISIDIDYSDIISASLSQPTDYNNQLHSNITITNLRKEWINPYCDKMPGLLYLKAKPIAIKINYIDRDINGNIVDTKSRHVTYLVVYLADIHDTDIESKMKSLAE